ncbi:hypothetical protein [Streptomyces lichenis]|uniref:Uncharacterized protein n=1 Tax=Streptomyces lichenis TaxID=2306967 RepID=A0ABT0IC43_9ACTN|nr:hypothetical protein [Streptomyces lichenis]MCK8678885.1 hypothetical protein [Streptomyces lichenis]
MTDTEPAGRVHRALTADEMAAIAAAIEAVGTAGGLVPATAYALYTALGEHLRPALADHVGTAPAPLPAHARFAIPEAQWLAIAERCIARAEAFGAGVHAALELRRVMPARYADPGITTPARLPRDHRPPAHELSVTREATDTITAASRHCERLAQCFGPGSDEHLAAVRSWQCGLSRLFAMAFGAHTRVERADPLSLTVTSETTGFVYGLHFRPALVPPADAPRPGRWLSVY